MARNNGAEAGQKRVVAKGVAILQHLVVAQMSFGGAWGLKVIEFSRVTRGEL